MANVLAVKIRPRKNTSPKAGNLAHNSGLTKAKYWLDENPQIEQKFTPKNTKELNAIWNSWVSNAEQRYLDNPHTKTKLRSQAVRIEEGMLIVGTDVATNRDTIKKIMHDFIDQFEKDNNTNVLHWAIHDEHEGHVDENGKEIHNRHIHFLFDNVDKDGKMVRSKWTRQYMKDLQTQIFEIGQKHISGIERAKNTTYNSSNPEQKSTHGLSHRDYRTKKENQTKAKTKDLKEKIKELREELRENQAQREQHAMLEKINRELQEKLKNKELTVQQLQTELDSARIKLLESLQAQKEQKVYIDTLEQSFALVEQKIKELETKNNRLLEAFRSINQLLNLDTNKLNALMQKIEDLAKQEKKEYAVIHFNGGYSVCNWQGLNNILDNQEMAEKVSTDQNLIEKIKRQNANNLNTQNLIENYKKR